MPSAPLLAAKQPDDKLLVLWTVPAQIKPTHMGMHLYREDTLMALVQNEIRGLVIATQQPLQRVNF